jgi:cob(I)alamin adenosyltransferase
MFYTRKGDSGTSGLFGDDTRYHKGDPIFQALGTVDELNSLLGVCYAKAERLVVCDGISVSSILRQLQEDLFIIQAELAGSGKSLTPAHVLHIEANMAEIEIHIENPKAFVISGSDETSAFLDYARTVARRAEREVLAVPEPNTVSLDTKIYLNRLSSVLYVLARYVATKANGKEQNPSY